MKKYLMILVAMFGVAMVVTFYSYARSNTLLGIDVAQATLEEYVDTHGGFHGDGYAFASYQLEKPPTLSSEWKPLPMDEETATLVYGWEDNGWRRGPYVSDYDGVPLFPPVKEGRYRLVDRQGGKSDFGILERASFNFTVALYDEDSNRLYYYELDT